MLYDNILSSEFTDIGRVTPNLALDMDMALASGTLSNTGTETEYNELSDVKGSWYRVNDVFSSLDALRRIQGSAKAAASAASAPAPENDPNS